MRVLVIGGAGYIGAHMCKMLAEHGHAVSVLDDLSTGHENACRFGTLHVGDCSDTATLRQVFGEARPEAVMHFAAKSLVAESVQDPYGYYASNFNGTMALANCIKAEGGMPLVFSSTGAVYGKPQTSLIDELHPCMPINPYGSSKLFSERMLADYWRAFRQPCVSFRYFNAAGADPSGTLGEAHDPETHLIPKILETCLRAAEPICINGTDYDTPDGTCIRDYVHVNDICRAHLLGLAHLAREPGKYIFNLGNGSGYSIRQVISVAEQVVGRSIPHQVGARREGDPAMLVADASLAKNVLGWTPEAPSLETIVETAWRWHRQSR